MKKERKTGLKVALILTILLVIAACLLLTAMTTLLAMSATPEMMPVRWTLMCVSPFVVGGLLVGSILAYRTEKAKLLYGLPVVLVIYIVIVTLLFTNLGPDW